MGPGGGGPRPVFVIVPGATQNPAHYAHLTHLLQLKGFGVVVGMLPSLGTGAQVRVSDDAEYVRQRLLLPLLDREQCDVVLVMHSYGSLPGSVAALGLAKAERAATGHAAGVLGQVFIGSALPRGGEEKDVIESTIEGKWPPQIGANEAENVMRSVDDRHYLFHDVPAGLAAGAMGSVVSNSLTPFKCACPPTSWHTDAFTGRCAYMRTRRDRILPYEVQCAQFDGLREDDWLVRELDTGHSPQLVAPRQVRDFVLDAAQWFQEPLGSAPPRERPVWGVRRVLGMFKRCWQS